jgi:hypothetical protein
LLYCFACIYRGSAESLSKPAWVDFLLRSGWFYLYQCSIVQVIQLWLEAGFLLVAPLFQQQLFGLLVTL